MNRFGDVVDVLVLPGQVVAGGPVPAGVGDLGRLDQVVAVAVDADEGQVVASHLQALLLCTPLFVQKGKCPPIVELTPTLLQMPRDVTNISED